MSNYDPVAQLVEQFPFKEEVLGSNPSRVTKIKIRPEYSGRIFILFYLFFTSTPP